MKRLGTILLACALILGMSQCKKENTNANAGSEQVYIELKVENGQRADVTPSTGAYDYNDGDKLLVGYNGVYKGFLVYDAETGIFSNTLDITKSGDQPLHFYYLNGQEPTETDNQYTFSISDQSAGLPVIAYAASRENFPSANGTYSARLRNKCALVKFTTGATPVAVKVSGMKNKATVSFSGTPGITSTGATGDITLFSESSTDKWAVLLPQEAVTGEIHVGKNFYAVSVPKIEDNGYVTSGVTIGAQLPKFTFSVSDDEAVQFSPGNLQATTSDKGALWTWSFAANQYDCIGNNPGNTTINGSGTVSSSGTVTVDLFGWVGESSSYDNYGIFNSITDSDYGTNSSDNLKHDWGVEANAANLGGHNDWRTLTGGAGGEWEYLFNTRTTTTNLGTTNARYAKGTVNGVKGMILFPDNYTHPTGVTLPVGINATGNTGWNGNTYTAEQWALMESAGAVFLPAASERDYYFGTAVDGVGYYGYYWSATPSDDCRAHYLRFSGNSVYPTYSGSRYRGFSVRLVR